MNITGTCDRDQEGEGPVLNLITDTTVDVVSAPDCGFLPAALDATREITTGEIEKAYVDGAYNSVPNQEYCQGEDISLILTGMQGPEPRSGIQLDEHDQDNLMVTDKKTGITVRAQQVKTRKDKTKRKWRIKTGKGKYRYFDEDNLRTAALRRKLKEIPPEESNLRNNVEASIFQLGYHYPNDKTRYRTLAGHKLWVYSRSLWINFVRIVNYSTRICQGTLCGQKLLQYIVKLCFNIYIIASKLLINKTNHNCPVKLHFSVI